MKKALSIAVAALILMTVATTPALAGSHHGKSTTAVRYAVCSVRNCAQTGLHLHSRTYYNAHYYGDGHTYHDYCGIVDCVLAGYHAHDGVYHFGHHANDGHDYHGYCSVSNCSLAGYHEHSGSYYFAHHANDGHGHNQRGRGGCH